MAALSLLCLVTMLQYAIVDLYADPWRTYPKLLSLPFPDSLLFLDNGHRPVVASILRLLDLHLLAGNQRLLQGAGIVLVGVSVAAGCWTALRSRASSRAARAAAALLVVAAVCWLGNARFLGHPFEASHAYLVLACVFLIGALAAGGLERPVMSTRRLAAVCALGAIAAFSFAPGLCALPALAATLLVARRHRDAAHVLAGWMVVLALYLAAPETEGIAQVIALDPARNLRVLMLWLSAPPTMALLPMLDPATTVPGLPAPLARVVAAVAGEFAARFGSARTGTTPQLLLGLCVLCLALVASVRAWRAQPGRLAVLGQLMTAFGLVTGGLIAITRLAYFDAQPDQVFANRYLPWSSLFWGGLAVSWIADLDARGRARALGAARVLVLGCALWLLATGFGYRAWAQAVQELAHRHALAVATSAFDVEQKLGESLLADLVAAAPVLRRHAVGPFAGGFARTHAAPAAPAPACAVLAITVEARNAFGGPLWRIASVEATPLAGRQPRRADWLLAGPDGAVVGFLAGGRGTRGLSGASTVDPGRTPLRLVDPESGMASEALVQGAATGLPACDAAAPAPR